MSPSSDRVSGLLEAMDRAEPRREPARHREGPAPGPLTVPVALRRARIRVAAPVLVGAVVVVLAVVAVLGVRVVWAQRSSEPTPIPSADHAVATATAPVSAGPAGMPSAGGATPPATPAAPGPLYVHVIGAVSRAGVVDIPAGSRVADAVEAAGGLAAKADPSRLNLARPVSDGERIWVPVEGEEPPREAVGQAGPAGGGTGASAPTESSAAQVDLNSADSTALQTLPGIGPVTAEAILTWRAEHGRFSTAEELLEVSGIGPRTLERVRSQVTVGP